MNHLKPFKMNEQFKDYLDNTTTVGELKEFLKGLPNDIPLILHSQSKNRPQSFYIKVINGKKIDIPNPITGEFDDYLLIGID